MARIVIVDDSMIARANLKLILQDEHEIVAEGANGLEGYDLYVQHRPDLLFLDITMPCMTGLECFKKLRNEYPDVKAVFVTSVNKSVTLVEAIDYGACDYVTKPFSRRAILSAVSKALKE